MWVNVGRMFALLLLAACPMLNGIARGQDASADPPKPLVQVSCKIKTACFKYIDGTESSGSEKTFISAPKDNCNLALIDALNQMKEYERTNPCPAGYQRNPKGRYECPSTALDRSSGNDNCCPTDGKWKVTIACKIELGQPGQPSEFTVYFPCFGNTRLKAKRAAEAELKTFLCEIGQNCKCCKVFTERVKPTPVCCN